MREFELEIMRWFESMRTDTLNDIVELITIMGEELLLIFIITIMFYAFDKRLAMKTLFITIFSLNINGIIKNIAQVPRPFADGSITCVRPETATGYSFPSAHTQTFATWTTMLATHFKSIAFGGVALVFILLMAFSRVYLGAHFPSDVTFAVCLGILIGVTSSIVYDKVPHRMVLILGFAAIVTPFACYFLWVGDPHFDDFFKMYGMLLGLPIALKLDERFAQYECTGAWWRKLLRILIAVALTLGVKEVFEMAFAFEAAQLALASSIFIYACVIIVGYGLCPLLFKRIRL